MLINTKANNLTEDAHDKKRDTDKFAVLICDIVRGKGCYEVNNWSVKFTFLKSYVDNINQRKF